tara:strand:- start:169 stop:1779 length:1611 start_codon:yes stop_codon:yes gene_type:complete
MTYGENGSVVGPQNLPTSSAASGVWSMGEVAEASRDSLWPAPFTGWMAQYAPNVTRSGTPAPSYNNVLLDLDTNNDIVLTATAAHSSGNAGMFGKITSSGTLTSTHDYVLGSTSNVFRICGLTVDTSNNIYIGGDWTSGGPYAGIWRAKLDSSLSEIWFNNRSDEAMRITANANTYSNSNYGLRASPNGNAVIDPAYGLYSSGYNQFTEPVRASDGYSLPWVSGSYKAYANPSTSTNMGSSTQAIGINNTNLLVMGRVYDSGYGGYINFLNSGGNTLGNQPNRCYVSPRGGTNNSNYFGVSNAKGYKTAANNNRYPWVSYVESGATIGSVNFTNCMAFQQWNYASGWNLIDLQTQFFVNPADSPMTPTNLWPDSMEWDSTDTTLYILCRDNGSTPNQNYLIAYTPGTQTIEWQRKLVISKTGQGSSTTQSASNNSLVIDSNDEFLHMAFHTTNSGLTSDKLLVMKLPVNGDGSGTWTVGDYTVVYEASNITKVHESTLTAFFNAGSMYQHTATNYANDPGTATSTSMTGTLTEGSK